MVRLLHGSGRWATQIVTQFEDVTLCYSVFLLNIFVALMVFPQSLDLCYTLNLKYSAPKSHVLKVGSTSGLW